MEKITIIVRQTASGITTPANSQTHQAEFEAVRTVKGSSIGWATIRDPEMTFPVIVDRNNDRVLTVDDWQDARWYYYVPGKDEPPVDLADPKQIAEMLQYGSSQFRTAAGAISSTPYLFTTPEALATATAETHAALAGR